MRVSCVALMVLSSMSANMLMMGIFESSCATGECVGRVDDVGGGKECVARLGRGAGLLVAVAGLEVARKSEASDAGVMDSSGCLELRRWALIVGLCALGGGWMLTTVFIVLVSRVESDTGAVVVRGCCTLLE